MKRSYISFSAVVAFLGAAMLTGCEKYVNIKTQGNLVPNQWLNYRYILNDQGNFSSGAAIPEYSCDDIQIVDGSIEQKAVASYAYAPYYPLAYCWQQVIFPATSSYYNDADWNGLYNSVTNANVVIEEVPNVTDSSGAANAELIAEALVHRADAYLQLVNSYARPYSSATASSEPGVPLVLKETTTQSLTRASVATVYDQVIADLHEAVPALPATQLFTFLPTKGAAYAELARCYLYMNLYDSANKYADSALAQNNTLNNLGAISSFNSSTYPIQLHDQEIYLAKNPTEGSATYSPLFFRLSDTLLKVLTPTDQRYVFFTGAASAVSYGTYSDDPTGRYWYRENQTYETRNVGPTVPEMMLIKAEYYARNNDPAGAMTWVNQLRSNRFTPANYAALTATDGDDALLKVVQERQREFFCRMLRWWDMRRLKSEARFQQTVTRVFSGVTYTLDPSSSRYVIGIAPYELKLNPEIQQNP